MVNKCRRPPFSAPLCSSQGAPPDPIAAILADSLPSVDTVLQASAFFAGIALNPEYDIVVMRVDEVSKVEIRDLRPGRAYDVYFSLQALEVRLHAAPGPMIHV